MKKDVQNVWFVLRNMLMSVDSPFVFCHNDVHEGLLNLTVILKYFLLFIKAIKNNKISAFIIKFGKNIYFLTTLFQLL